MEIANLMSTPAQMPQAAGEATTADGAGAVPARGAHSAFFGLLLGQQAGGDDAGKSPADAVNDPSPFSCPGEKGTTANGVLNGLPQGAFQRVSGTFPAGLVITAAAASVRISQKLAGLNLADQEWSKAGGLAGNGEAITGEEPAEEAQETPTKAPGHDSLWLPLFAVGNPFVNLKAAGQAPIEGDPAAPQGGSDAAASLSGNPIQAASGDGQALPAIPVAAVNKGLPESVIPSLPDSLKGVGGESQPLAGALPGDGGKEAQVKTTAVNIPTKGDMPFAAKKEMIGEMVADSRLQGAKPLPQTAPTKTTEEVTTNSRSSESAGNAYRAAAGEPLLRGGVNGASIAGAQTAKAPVALAATALTGGVDPARVEVVFAEGQGGSRGDSGEEGTQKSREGKSSDSSSTVSPTSNGALFKMPGEGVKTNSVAEAKNQLAEQITSQVREKLDARGNAPGDGQISLKLHPEELGELKINMRMGEHGLKVEIVTQNPAVKEALLQNLDTLKETLARQNIAMNRFDVSAGLQQGFQQGARDGRQAQENRNVNNVFRENTAVAEDASPSPQYRWENEESLISVTL